jgi:hypothetical protein
VARVTSLQRAAARLRDRGYQVEILRRRKGGRCRRRYTPFGFADLIGLKPSTPPVAVLVVGSPSIAFRTAFILPEQPAAAAWLNFGLIWIWTLHRTGPGRHKLWYEFTVPLDQRGIKDAMPDGCLDRAARSKVR